MLFAVGTLWDDFASELSERNSNNLTQKPEKGLTVNVKWENIENKGNIGLRTVSKTVTSNFTPKPEWRGSFVHLFCNQSWSLKQPSFYNVLVVWNVPINIRMRVCVTFFWRGHFHVQFLNSMFPHSMLPSHPPLGQRKRKNLIKGKQIEEEDRLIRKFFPRNWWWWWWCKDLINWW